MRQNAGLDMNMGDGTHRSRSRRNPLVALATLAVAASGYAWPASVTHPFRMSVAFEPGASCVREVSRGDGRAKVNINCGQPSTDRFLLHVYRAGEWLGEIEGDMASGTITTWRVVHVANRDYLEIMVGW